jgi:ribosomal protein S18 acetylase RimI-like enzyme
LVLQDRGREATEAIRAALAAQANSRGDIDGLVAALREEELVAALPMRYQPGRTAQLWLPRLIAGESSQTAMLILNEATHIARQRGCSLVQALPESQESGELPLLEAAGFRHIADLLYMVSPLDQVLAEPQAVDLQLVPLAAANQDRLASMIDRSYIGTRDCPALNGVRSLEDVLEGYRSIGLFDPAYWFIVRHEDQDIGCLLLANHNNTGQWELVYLGLSPDARGRGYARWLVRQAQRLARHAGAGQLVLAVDADNAPAVSIYLRSGFVIWDRRPIYLRILTNCSRGA